MFQGIVTIKEGDIKDLYKILFLFPPSDLCWKISPYMHLRILKKISVEFPSSKGTPIASFTLVKDLSFLVEKLMDM